MKLDEFKARLHAAKKKGAAAVTASAAGPAAYGPVEKVMAVGAMVHQGNGITGRLGYVEALKDGIAGVRFYSVAGEPGKQLEEVPVAKLEVRENASWRVIAIERLPADSERRKTLMAQESDARRRAVVHPVDRKQLEGNRDAGKMADHFGRGLAESVREMTIMDR